MTGLTLEQIERRPDGPQARPRPVTQTAWAESRLAVVVIDQHGHQFTFDADDYSAGPNGFVDVPRRRCAPRAQ